MFAYMLATLVLFAFAGTVLMLPAFRSDLVDFVRSGRTEDADLRQVHELIARTSIIIPARNEAESLPVLLDSLKAQSIAPREIVVVDDQSEDDTVDVAERACARVVSAGERPKNWLGKPWAVSRGATEARGTYLLFLDADVRLAPTALEGIGRAVLQSSPNWPEDTTTISVQPYHRTVKPWERLAFLFNILVFVGSARRKRGLQLSMSGSCCFGPCIFCGRKEHSLFGGHRAVKNRVLDDMELGSAFRKAGVATRSFSGRGIIEYRMYPSNLRDLLDGFTKNILHGARRSVLLFRVFSVLWFTGMLAVPPYIIMAAAAGMLPELVVALVFYTFFVIQTASAGERLGNFGPLPAIFFPLHLAVFLFVLLRAVVLALSGRNVRWKGRRLDPESFR